MERIDAQNRRPRSGCAIVAIAIALAAPAGALAKMKVYDPWLDEAARDPERVLADAGRAALEALERPLPPRRPRARSSAG